jgi:hypothetical protein
LERRRLLSGWTTVEEFDAGNGAYYFDIAADSAGNLYAAGHEGGHPIIRQKLAGGGSWSTVYSSTVTGPRLTELEVTAAGDVYAAGTGSGTAMVLRRAAGQSAFTTIATGATGMIEDLEVNSAGDVFTAGYLEVTRPLNGNKTVTEGYWAVRKQAAGQGAFTTVDQFFYNSGAHAQGISIVESGPNAGIYVVGNGSTSTTARGVTTTTKTAVVRKSTNGGSSWTTIDTFRYQGAYNSTGEAIATDAAGNIYVSGVANSRILTRKSTNGTTFAIVDAMPLASNLAYAYAMTTDHASNVYVVGMMSVYNANNVSRMHGYIRSNAGGTWATVDDFFEGVATSFHGVTADPAGDVFVSGMSALPGNSYARAIVRTNSPPAAVARFSSQRISLPGDWSDRTPPERHEFNEPEAGAR